MQQFLFSVLAVLFMAVTYSILPNNSEEKLILFTHSTQPIISQADIQAIAQLSTEMKIDFVMKHDSLGLPEEVTTLPRIYFQNDKGRSAYYGRYTNTSRIKNFIRTAKLAHQKNKPNPKEQVLIWQKGRTAVSAPLKITKLMGVIPPNFDQVAFEQQAKQAIACGMKQFDLLEEFNVTKNTRSFYINIYPYLNQSHQLFLTTEIFSQFNCVNPTYSYLETPLVEGKWKKQQALFKQIGRLMETEIIRQIQASEIGDAFHFVNNDVPPVSWETLGLAIAKTETKTVHKQQDSLIAIPQKWTVEQQTNQEEPILIFSFLAPVDNYAGEVKALSGQMALGNDGSMKGATGKFVVNIADVTMGAEDFDHEVQFKMLKRKLFPTAQFEFVEVVGSSRPLKLGKTASLVMKGEFTLLGITTPIEVDTQMEPFIDNNGKVKLTVNCTFALPLMEKFGVKGPDGPSPAKDNLQFYLQFNMVADGKKL